MNYYEPKQRTTDGRWDYTRNNFATGYCCEFRKFSEEFVKNFHILESEVEKHNSFSHKYHMGGHDTSEAACKCYKEYLLDHKLRLGAKMSNEQRKCEICGEWTQLFAEIDISMFVLCEKHNDRDHVAKIYEASSWSMSSW